MRIILILILLMGLVGCTVSQPSPVPTPTEIATPTARPTPLSIIYLSTESIVEASVVELSDLYGTGTGFFITTSGMIVTANHVIETDHLSVRLPSGDRFTGEVVERFPEDDLALVEVINANGQSFQAIPIGNVDDVRVRDEVTVIGYPLGLDQTINVGRVSAKRTNEIQLDISAEVGNSGSPVLDVNNMVIGVVTSKVEGSSIVFASPISHVVDSTHLQVDTPLPTPTPSDTVTSSRIATNTPRPPQPTPTNTPIPPTPTLLPEMYCGEWEEMILDWISEGNIFEVESSSQIGIDKIPFWEPRHDRLDPYQARNLCNLDFPIGILMSTPPGKSGWFRIGEYQVKIGTGPDELLPGKYQYGFAQSGVEINGSTRPSPVRKSDCVIGLDIKSGVAADLIEIEQGKPFFIDLNPDDGVVAYYCDGDLYRVPD